MHRSKFLAGNGLEALQTVSRRLPCTTVTSKHKSHRAAPAGGSVLHRLTRVQSMNTHPLTRALKNNLLECKPWPST